MSVDAQDVLRCQAGQAAAFEPLVRRYQNAAYALALTYLRDPSDAQDVVQDAFIAAYCKLGQLRQPAAFGGWFRRIVLTRCQAWLRRRRMQTHSLHTVQEAQAALHDTALREHAARLWRLEVWQAVERLPEPYRTVVLLHYLSGWSADEMAAFLEVPVSTVKGRLQQARLKLRAALAGDVKEELMTRRIEVTHEVQQVVHRITTAFEPDLRVFTAHAFMNMAGYDWEWHQEGMHPIRQAVRAALMATVEPAFQQRARAFYQAHGNTIDWGIYGPYALCTAGPPEFELRYDPATTDPWVHEVVKNYDGLSPLLAEFFRQGDLPRLWEQHRPAMQQENLRFQPFVYNALDDVITYCKLDPQFFETYATQVSLTVSPLMSVFTNQSFKINNHLYILQYWHRGEAPSEASFYFHVAGPVIAPLTAQYREQIHQLESLHQLAAEPLRRIGYSSWDGLFHLALLKTLGCRLWTRRAHRTPEEEQRWLDNEYRLGFLFCPALGEALDGYERSGQALAEYFPTLLASLDVERETKRWQAFTARQNVQAFQEGISTRQTLP